MWLINAAIVTYNKEKLFIPKGYVKIHEGMISEVGSMENLKEIPSDALDVKGQIIMPGFICTHSHIYSAFARGMGLKGSSPSNFTEILEMLWWRLDKTLSLEDIYYSALVTLMECAKNGVTTLFDHHASPNSISGSLDVIERAFLEIGLRGTLCYEVSDRDGKAKALEGIEENLRYIKKDKNPLVKGLFGLHASFTLSDETLKLCSEKGNEIGAGFHIHAAEGEADLIAAQSKDHLGVVQRLNKYNILKDNSILAHCIHILPEEIELLKKTQVVHNPESNMNNAVGYCDVEALCQKGVLVGLGSDGFSSNPFRAMDCCYVLHKHCKATPQTMFPSRVTELAILNNRKIASKYFDVPLGVIEEGAQADLIVLDYKPYTPINSDNFDGHLIFGINSNHIVHTMVEGRFVVKDRILCSMDEDEIYQKAMELASKVWKRF